MSSDDDRTILRPLAPQQRPDTSALEVTVSTPDGGQQTLRFTQTFRIGRDQSCEIKLNDDTVSRQHAEIRFDQGCWWICDLGSSNGTYFNGQRIDESPIKNSGYVQLGRNGPVVRFSLPQSVVANNELVSTKTKAVPERESAEKIYQRYFDPGYSGQVGERTMMVRRAIQGAAKSQTRRYWAAIGTIALMLVVAVGIISYQHLRLQKVRGLTVDIFYNMKEIELQVADLQEKIRITGAVMLREELVSKQDKLREMQARYDTLLREAGLISPSMSEQDRVIFHIARVFGECELNMPPGFVKKVKEYIAKWKATERLADAIKRAEEAEYPPYIMETLAEYDLPPHFFYLALQESSYDDKAVGPQTRFGIAKGIWQFIPSTAKQYGLRTGPLAHLRRYDAQDERFHFAKATQAAAKYLKYIYATEAQASGLLVIASYNWGESRVRNLIRKMPENPRERNFWELIKSYRIPQETYDYVFYIVSAAVIGEDPQLFGFDFAHPLHSARSVLSGKPIAYFSSGSTEIALGPNMIFTRVVSSTGVSTEERHTAFSSSR